LLAAPVSLPTDGLVLASAERADLLVDFSDLPAGTELTLWNTAAAPFDGASVDPTTAGTPNLEGLLRTRRCSESESAKDAGRNAGLRPCSRPTSGR
jgi:hypothetical protein